jgi:hypothetical protein
MTIDHGRKIEIPYWGIQLLAAASIAGVSFTATHFFDNVMWKAHMEDRVAVIEKIIPDIVAEQRTNSNARILITQELKEIQETTEANNHLLVEHITEDYKQRNR